MPCGFILSCRDNIEIEGNQHLLKGVFAKNERGIGREIWRPTISRVLSTLYAKRIKNIMKYKLYTNASKNDR